MQTDQRKRHGASRLFVLCLLLSFCPRAIAQSPRQELLRLVPPDVAICAVIEDLRGHGEALLKSPFLKRFAPAIAGMAQGDEVQKLDFVDKWLQENLQVSSVQLRDDILGDALVIAYRPGPPAKPEQEQGLLLVHARDPKLLARLIDRLNQIQRDSGDLKELTDREFMGRTYHRREDQKDTNFYYLNGPVLAFAPKEEILKELIAREAQRDSDSPLVRAFMEKGTESALVSVWINPRVYDAPLRLKLEAAQGADNKALKTFQSYWQAIDGLGIRLVLDKEIRLDVSLRFRPEALPAAARRLAELQPGGHDVFNYLPDNALVSVGGRVDIPALVDAWADFVAEEARHSLRNAIDSTVGAVLGKDIVETVLPSLGPEWGACVLAPPGGAPHWLPQALAALRVKPNKSGETHGALALNTLNALATLIVFQTNGGHPGPTSLKLTVKDGVEVRYLVNPEHFPPGFEPAFAMKHGYLVVATSPDALDRFAPSKREAAGDRPILRISFSEARRYLKDHRQAIAAFCAAKHEISDETAGQHLDRVAAILEFLDSAEIRKEAGPDRLTLSLHVRLAEALK
jgi:hypothetical protein